MCSPMAQFAVARCPFLAAVAQEKGQAYAEVVALAPTQTVGSGPLPAGREAVLALAHNYSLVHGPAGLLPLCPAAGQQPAVGPRAGCPFAAAAQAPTATALGSSSSGASAAAAPPKAQCPIAAHGGRPLPVASLSFSNFGKGPNFGDFLRKQLNKKQQHGPGGPNNSNSRHPQPRPGPASSSAASGGAGGSTGGPPGHQGGGPLGGSSTFNKPPRPLGDPGNGVSGTGHMRPPGASAASASSWVTSPPTANSGSSGGPSPLQQQRATHRARQPPGGAGSSSNSKSPGGGAQRAGGAGGGAASSSGAGGRGRVVGTTGSSSSGAAAQPPSACPLRKWLGPAAGLVFNEYDKIICPPAIVAARAALARTAPVQQLRPQALPVKLLAVAAVVAGVNLPAGAVREHFEKFSVGWFVAVHVTIPFVAMLRKAVIMPKFAILATIAAAVVGQMVGARLERARLAHEELHGPLLPLLAPPAAPAGSGAVSEPVPQRQQVMKKKPQKQKPAAAAPYGQAADGGSNRVGRWSRQRLAVPDEQRTASETCRASASRGGPTAVLAHPPVARA